MAPDRAIRRPPATCSNRCDAPPTPNPRPRSMSQPFVKARYGPPCGGPARGPCFQRTRASHDESTRVPESPRGGRRRGPAHLRARRARPEGGGEALRRRQAVRAGQLPALHRLPRATHARALPRAVGEPRHRRRQGPAAAPRRQRIPEALRGQAGHARGARVHLPRLHGGGPRLRQGRWLRPHGHAGEAAPCVAPPCAAARRRRHLAGLRHGAVDQRSGHGRRLQAPRRRRDGAALGVHARRGSGEADRREGLRGEDRLRRAEREDHGLRRPGLLART